MNTYVQDETIPIYIFLSYGGNVLKFPINPENLKIERESSSRTVVIEGLGQVSVPGTQGLATLSINSFFWHRVNLLPASLYVSWLEKWQASKEPAKLVVTRRNLSMQVTCERFSHDMRAGEEKDIYFELDLQEYKPHGAKLLNQVTNSGIVEKAKALLGTINTATPPVLVEIPRPSRGRDGKETIGNVFKTVSGWTTILAIAKKVTGSTENWREIFDENKSVLSNIIMDGGEIPVGTELKVPAKYVTGSGGSILDGGL